MANSGGHVFSLESRIIRAQERAHQFDLISSQLLFTGRVVFPNKQTSSACKEVCAISHISIDEFYRIGCVKEFPVSKIGYPSDSWVASLIASVMFVIQDFTHGQQSNITPISRPSHIFRVRSWIHEASPLSGPLLVVGLRRWRHQF
jgi:hypothetical protein